MEYNIIEYPNGIKAVLKCVKSPVVYTSLTIGAATRDEGDDEFGVAHFMEHMLFKGTQKRRQYHINTLLDNVGGELNAYTTKEETVVHATTLKSDFVKAVDLICDVAFNSVCSGDEIELERTVIVDEINSYKESPSELIFDQFEDIVFAQTELGHPILGTPKSLKKMTSQKLLDFRARTYNTDVMVFAVCGNISLKRFKDVCDSYLAPIQSNLRSWKRKAVGQYNPTNVEINKRGYQRHFMLGGRAYSHFNNDRVALSLLVNMLGGQSPSSILNQELREKNGLTYNVEANYTSFIDTGIVSVYFSCEADKFERCNSILQRELDKVKSTAITPTKLSRFKRQLKGQIAIASENSESLMLASARSLLTYSEIDSLKRVYQKIDSLTPSGIQKVANEIFDSNNLSSLTYL